MAVNVFSHQSLLRSSLFCSAIELSEIQQADGRHVRVDDSPLRSWTPVKKHPKRCTVDLGCGWSSGFRAKRPT